MSNPRRRTLIAIVAILIVTAVGIVVVPLLLPPKCEAKPATPLDFQQATSIGSGIFEPERWRLETGEHPGLISVGWFEDEHEGLAHAQLLLYDCGYTSADLENFYGEQGMNIMLGGYNAHTQTAQCTDGELTLREYDVDYDGRPYRVRFWFEPVSDTRVRDMHLGFLPEDQALMDDYAARLYPQLPSCPQS